MQGVSEEEITFFYLQGGTPWTAHLFSFIYDLLNIMYAINMKIQPVNLYVTYSFASSGWSCYRFFFYFM